MAAKYWLAKHIPDPLRAEPRNIGVIVSVGNAFAARFIGERDDGKGLDGRKLGDFAYPDVYRQWVAFWRGELAEKRIDEIVASATPHFVVVEGGEVADTGTDSASDVCQFLYTLLVSHGGAKVAFELEEATVEEIEKTKQLKEEIYDTFYDLNLMEEAGLLAVAHPIQSDRNIQGRNARHIPSFVQRNGHLFVYEVVDFTRRRKNAVTERAGFCAYMFSDIRAAIKNAEPFSIVRPSEDTGGLEYAKSMLSAESQVINWDDDNQRQEFLDKCMQVALSDAI